MGSALGGGWGLESERVKKSVGEGERVSGIDGGASGPFRAEVLESIGGHVSGVSNDLLSVFVINRLEVCAREGRICDGPVGDGGIMALPNFLMAFFWRGV